MTDNEILNMVFQKVATLPGTVVEGKPLHNTGDDNLYIGLNGVWVDLTALGVTVITGGSAAITIDATDPSAPIINIADANTTTSGFMSAAHFDLLTAATTAADPDSLVLRDAAGSATFEAITINGTPTNATDAATKQYVDNLAAAGLRIVGTIDASTNPNYPAATNGEAYHVSVAGKIGGASGIDVEIGDLVTAVADNAGGTQASVGSDWIIMQTNIDQATTTVRGAIRIATSAEVAAGTSVDTAVTPVTLAEAIAALGSSETQDALIGDGVATSISVSHTLDSENVQVSVYDVATGEICMTDVTSNVAGTVVIGTTLPLALNAARVVITGTK